MKTIYVPTPINPKDYVIAMQTPPGDFLFGKLFRNARPGLIAMR